MKAKLLSTQLKDLYGINYFHEHIKEGDEFWSDADFIQVLTHKKWNKLHVTYVRSGAMFFTIEDSDVPEQYMATTSFAAATMIKAKIDPYKEFPDRKDIDDYCFDDTFTEVINFDNNKDKEVADEINLF